MSASGDGELDFLAMPGSVVVHFERMLPCPPKQVWEHLLDRDRLTEWLTSEPGGHIRRDEGGEVLLPTIGGALIESAVIEFIPEDTLVFGWDTREWEGGVVGWRLDSEADGTGLIFEHEDDALDPEHYARTLATWHLTLDWFKASLSGAPQPWTYEAWERLFYGYGHSLIEKLGLD